jgi:hypothetical protein
LSQRDASNLKAKVRHGGGDKFPLILEFQCLPHCDEDFIVLQAHCDSITELP